MSPSDTLSEACFVTLRCLFLQDVLLSPREMGRLNAGQAALPSLHCMRLLNNGSDAACIMYPPPNTRLRSLTIGEEPVYISAKSRRGSTTDRNIPTRLSWRPPGMHRIYTQLRVLSLCSLGTTATPVVTPLCTHLRQGSFPCLAALYLSDNHITSAEATALGAALAERPRGRRGVHTLELGYNCIRDATALLEHCGRFDTPLRYLGLGSNDLHTLIVPRRPYHLRRLTELVLECNEFDLHTAWQIYHHVLDGELPQLRILDMEDNNIELHEQRELHACFEKRGHDVVLHNGFA